MMGKKKIATSTPVPTDAKVDVFVRFSNRRVARSVNKTQVVTNWLIGREIVEEEQAGSIRAGYGERLLVELSEQLQSEYGRGYSVKNLEFFRSCYRVYPFLVDLPIPYTPCTELGGRQIPDPTEALTAIRNDSRILYDQMLGRATRKCQNLYGEGLHKSAFRIFDAVDLYNALLPITDMTPVVARPSLTFGQLVTELRDIADAEFTEESKRQLLAKLRRRKLTANQEEKLQFELSTDSPGLTQDIEPPSSLASRDQ